MTRTHSRRWLSLATALLTISALVLPLSTSAQAVTNDNSMTLDVKPEQAVTATGVLHKLTAQITSAGGCLDSAECNIDFEVESGPGDLGNTQESPDHSCQIDSGLDSCFVEFTSTQAGTNLVRVWIDDDGTSDADADPTEGREISTAPGNRTEPMIQM